MNNQKKILFDQKTGRPIKKSFIENPGNTGLLYPIPISKGMFTPIYTTRYDRKIGDCYYPRIRFDVLKRYKEKNSTQQACVEVKTNWAVGRGCQIIENEDVENPNEGQQKILLQLKSRPNRENTFTQMIRDFVEDFYMTGNAYLEIQRSRLTGEILSMRYQPSHLIYKTVSRPGYFKLNTKTMKREYLNDFFNVDDKTKFDVVHFIKNKDDFSDFYGLPAIFSAIKEMDLEDETLRYVKAYYENGILGAKFFAFKEGNLTEKQRRERQEMINKELVGSQNAFGSYVAHFGNPNEDINIIDMSTDFDEQKIETLLNRFSKRIMRANGVSEKILDLSMGDNERHNFSRSIKVDQLLFEEFINNVLFETGITDWKLKFIPEDITTSNQDVSSAAQWLFGAGKGVEAGILTREEARDFFFPLLENIQLFGKSLEKITDIKKLEMTNSINRRQSAILIKQLLSENDNE